MAFEHASTIGSWYFQAVIPAATLENHTRCERAAHHNKLRGRMQYETGGFGGGTSLVNELDDGWMLWLNGVRIIRGPQEVGESASSTQGLESNPPADLWTSDTGGVVTWMGNPQVVFPTGIGLPPFLARPIVTANAVAFQLDAAALTRISWQGIDFNADGVLPTGEPYTIRDLDGDGSFPRVAVQRPAKIQFTGQESPADDTRTGLRFRLMLGRLGPGTADPQPGFPDAVRAPEPPSDAITEARGIFIHWQAVGHVRAY